MQAARVRGGADAFVGGVEGVVHHFVKCGVDVEDDNNESVFNPSGGFPYGFDNEICDVVWAMTGGEAVRAYSLKRHVEGFGNEGKAP